VTGIGSDVRTLLDGEDVSEEIRQPEVSLYASAVAAIPRVRRRLAARQREMALSGGGVLEGRDIGTKVVPEATAKFFLTARPEIRARRRFDELERKGTPQDMAAVRAEMDARDTADSTRADSPLAFDETYVVVDTSDLGAEDVAETLRGMITSRRTG
jgi:cytidylate kinase